MCVPKKHECSVVPLPAGLYTISAQDDHGPNSFLGQVFLLTLAATRGVTDLYHTLKQQYPVPGKSVKRKNARPEHHAAGKDEYRLASDRAHS